MTQRVLIGDQSEPVKLTVEDFATFLRVGRALATAAQERNVDGGYSHEVSVESDGTIRFRDDYAETIEGDNGEDYIYISRFDFGDDSGNLNEAQTAALAKALAEKVQNFLNE